MAEPSAGPPPSEASPSGPVRREIPPDTILTLGRTIGREAPQEIDPLADIPWDKPSEDRPAPETGATRPRRILPSHVAGGVALAAGIGVLAWGILPGTDKSTVGGLSGTDPVESPVHSIDEGELADVKRVVRGYLASATVGERVRYVREPSRVRPLMVDYYQRHPLVPISDAGFEILAAKELKGRAVMMIRLSGKEEEEEREINLAAVRGKDAWKVDWETHVTYNPVGWEEFLDWRPAEPVDMRVYASLDNYFNHQFDDPARFLCYRLEHPDSDRVLYAYVSERGDWSKRLFQHVRLRTRVPVIVSLAFPTDPAAGGPNQAHLTGFVSDSWLR